MKPTNAYAAILTARTQRHAPYPLHKLWRLAPTDKLADEVVFTVESHEDAAASDLPQLAELCARERMQLVVFDAAHFCSTAPHTATCLPVRPLGNDAAAMLKFIINCERGGLHARGPLRVGAGWG